MEPREILPGLMVISSVTENGAGMEKWFDALELIVELNGPLELRSVPVPKRASLASAKVENPTVAY